MKAKIVILITLLWISSQIFPITTTVEFKGGYFSPSEQAFKDIYGGGPIVGGEITIGIWKGIQAWIGGSYFNKNGELSLTKEETSLRIIPIGGGFKYFFQMKIFRPYIGFGTQYFLYEESNVLGDVNTGALGFLGKLGSHIKITKNIMVDVFLDYSYCKMKPADFEIDVGGITIGLGVGYSF